MFLPKLKKICRRKIGATLVGAMLALPLTTAVVPAPTAEASFDVWGAVIGGAISYAQAEDTISTYDKSDEGRQTLFQQMKNQYGVNTDPELNWLVDRIMTNLTKAIASVDESINERPYNYFINNQSGLNAFCSMGHNMSINTGLFNVLHLEDEIAVVLAHEMGHGQKNHVAKGIRNSIAPQVLAQATGGWAGLAATFAANTITRQGITKPMEREADSLAFDYIIHSDYNPGACAAVWQRVIDKSGNNPDTFIDFLAGGSDHPSHASRRDDYEKKLYEYSGEKVSVKDGVIKVNDKDFMTPAATADMSGAERAYLIAGNLAKAFHNRQNHSDARAEGDVIMLGNQTIATSVAGDEAADTLAERLAQIK